MRLGDGPREEGSFGSLSDQIGRCIVALLLVRSSYVS
jgi:hypothetical protein